MYIFLCVCHLYNNLSVHLFYFSLYLSSKLFICSISHSILIYHSLHFPNSPSLIGSLSLSPLSSDGVGRTGTFICLHSQLERLKTEGVADVLQAVKSARIQRAGLVRNAVCSVFCLSFSITLLSLRMIFSHSFKQIYTHSLSLSISIGAVCFLSRGVG